MTRIPKTPPLPARRYKIGTKRSRLIRDTVSWLRDKPVRLPIYDLAAVRSFLGLYYCRSCGMLEGTSILNLVAFEGLSRGYPDRLSL